MEVEIDLKKGAAKSAAEYYDRSKKAKRKIAGLKKAIVETKRKLKKAENKESVEPEKRVKRVRRERDWYEKFHWMFTTDGFLVIAGRDVKTNTEVVRKRMGDKDLYFHADIHGAPSTIIISDGKEVPEQTKKEAAMFAGTYSRAFGIGHGSVDVYCVQPEQVKLAAGAGESLPKGGFVIRGKREWHRNCDVMIDISYDTEKKRPFVGIGLKGKKLTVAPGSRKKGEAAKLVKRRLDEMFDADVSLDEVTQLLPSGSAEVKE